MKPSNTICRWAYWRCSQTSGVARITFDYRAYAFAGFWVCATIFGISWLVARQLPPRGNDTWLLISGGTAAVMFLVAVLQVTWHLCNEPPLSYDRPEDLLKLPRLHLEIPLARTKVVFQIIVHSSDDSEYSELKIAVDGTTYGLLGPNSSVRSVKETADWIRQMGFEVRSSEDESAKPRVAKTKP